MAFVHAMNSPDLVKKGVRGADVYTEDGVGDYRVTLFTMLNRNLDETYMNEYVTKIYNELDENANEKKRDLFVMAFQTRDIRGGKGEKKLFYYFLKTLYKLNPNITSEMMKLVPEYGCWRDMWEIIKYIPELEEKIVSIVKETYVSDMKFYNSGEFKKISLLSKWLPREHSGMYKGLAHKLAIYLYANAKISKRSCLVQYRKGISMLNKSLKTVEISMCGGKWADIVPENVPGRCLKLHTKAFLNEPLKLMSNNCDILRYPDNTDRMECREHFKEFAKQVVTGEKKAHGADVVLPHELVEKVLSLLKNSDTSEDEHNIIQGQWISIREETEKLGGFRKCIPMCDFSASMKGLPKLISLALGILISEVNDNAFKNHILTFDNEPLWHSFQNCDTLRNKLKTIKNNLGCGLNTNFYRACRRIIDKMTQYKIPVGEEPEYIIVLTDMGFDNAFSEHGISSLWAPQLNQIRNEFIKAGENVWGIGNGWKAPTIVVWNLRTEYKDFHATAKQEGVLMLSGWSPSMLKALQINGIDIKTPYKGMRMILDNERYDPVRAIWDSSTT
jgi:hypothetical protein